MHVVDQFILSSMGQVVAWPTILYVDNSGRRSLGHAFVATSRDLYSAVRESNLIDEP